MKTITYKILSLCLFLFLLATGCKIGDQRNKEAPVCKIDLQDIKETGKIVAVTDYNSTEYFLYRGEPMGYQYDLLKELANHLNVKLEVIVENDLERTFEYLSTGKCDLIALNLTVTKERSKRIKFTEPHSQTTQVLVQRKPEDWKMYHPENLEKKLLRNQLELSGKTIYVRKNSSFSERLYNLAEEIGDSIDIIEVAEDEEQLIRLVANGEIDYTVCDENVAMVNQTYYPILDIRTQISFPQNLAWAVRKEGSDNLLNDVNEWLKKFKKTLDYALIYNKYFRNQKSKEIIESDFFASSSGIISPYDEEIKTFSDSIGWDWLLLTSLIYQESRFMHDVRSWAGAYGLMQLMPSTASRYGINMNSSPAENIEAGAKFLKWLDNTLKNRVPNDEERIKFILASYNVGLGHIMDGMNLARKNGKDPATWDNNVDFYVLNKSNPEYYRDPVVKYGYCRGEEPFNYVAEIMERYDHYKNIIGNN